MEVLRLGIDPAASVAHLTSCTAWSICACVRAAQKMRGTVTSGVWVAA